MGDQVVPMHPEAVPESALELRWVIPAGTLSFVGEVTDVPDELRTLIDSDVIETLVVEPTAVRIRLLDSHSWRVEGAAIRSALQSSLAMADRWRPVLAGTSDDVLRAAVAEVINGEVGDYIRSHGGGIDVVSVADGHVEVSLGGACTHCPASDVTLTGRFEDAVRARFPGLRDVVARSDPGIAAGRRLLGVVPTLSRNHAPS